MLIVNPIIIGLRPVSSRFRSADVSIAAARLLASLGVLTAVTLRTGFLTIQQDHVGCDRAGRLVIRKSRGSERRRTQSLNIGAGRGAVAGNGGTCQRLLSGQACDIVDDPS